MSKLFVALVIPKCFLFFNDPGKHREQFDLFLEWGLEIPHLLSIIMHYKAFLGGGSRKFDPGVQHCLDGSNAISDRFASKRLDASFAHYFN